MRQRVRWVQDGDGTFEADVAANVTAWSVIEDHGDGTVTVEIERDDSDALRVAARMVADDKVRAATVTDDDAAKLAALYDPWVPNTTYAQGDLHAWDGTIIECIQAHTNHDPNHTPDVTPALWKVHRSGSGVQQGEAPAEWVQPDSQNGYSVGDRVTYNGQVYESTFDGMNVWSPEAYPQGWQLIE